MSELYLGQTPGDEECAQSTDPDYAGKAMAECRRYIAQLKRQFGEPPEGARFKIASELHSWGCAREVVITFDLKNEAAMKYAFDVEGDLPAKWEDPVDHWMTETK